MSENPSVAGNEERREPAAEHSPPPSPWASPETQAWTPQPVSPPPQPTSPPPPQPQQQQQVAPPSPWASPETQATAPQPVSAPAQPVSQAQPVSSPPQVVVPPAASVLSQPTAPQPGSPEHASSPTPPPAAPLPASPAQPAQPWARVPPFPQPAQPSEPGKARSGLRGWHKAVLASVAAVAIAFTAGGVGGVIGYALHPDSPGGSLQVTSTSEGGPAGPVLDRSSLADVAAAIQPTVVVIRTPGSEGSGVIISADGYIVTNNHVVARASGSQVNVIFNSGRTVTATIVGTDPKTDLAVVKADASGLTYATWGDSDAVRVGDTVLAIGSPLGLQGSVTAGIVSALHRTISVDNSGDLFGRFSGQGRTTIGDVIQTDAPINPGNSGGALVNLKGEVIGINTAIATSGVSGNIGVGFAISANRAKQVAEQLIKGEKVSHPYLGISITDAESGGAVIGRIESGGPADRAGLRVGDVVTKVNDQTITGSEDLVGAIQRSTVGETLTLTVVRDGSEITIRATVGEAP